LIKSLYNIVEMKLFGPPDADPLDTQARVRFITDTLDDVEIQKSIRYGITPNADYPVYSNTPFTDNVDEWKNPASLMGFPQNKYYIMLPAIPPTPEIPASNGVDAIPAQPGTPALTFPLDSIEPNRNSSSPYRAFVIIKFPAGELLTAFVSAPPVDTNAPQEEAPLTDRIMRSTTISYRVSFEVDPTRGASNNVYDVEYLHDNYVLNASNFEILPASNTYGIFHKEDLDRWAHPENHIGEFFTGHYLIRVPAENPSAMEQGIALIGIQANPSDRLPRVYTYSSIPELHMRPLRIVPVFNPGFHPLFNKVVGNYTRFPDSKDWITDWRAAARHGGRRKAKKARKTKKSKKSRKLRKSRK